MNSVPGMFCYFDPSTVSLSGTPSSITNVFSACTVSYFLAIGYISAKYAPLENTCAYRFLSNEITRPSMVSVAHMYVSLLVCNNMYALYWLTSGITADRVSICVVLDMVSIACSIPIYHCSLSSFGDTFEWRPFNWNVLSCGTYCTVAFDLDTFLDGIEATLTLKIIRLVMATMSYIWSTESLSLYVSVRLGDSPSVITAPTFLDISSSTVRELLGKLTFYGSYSYANKQVIFGLVCSYFYMGVLVATPSIVPLKDNDSIKSWSSVAMKIGASARGLHWNVIPYAWNWLGFTRVLSMVALVQISLLRIRIMVSPVLGLWYDVASWTTGTDFIFSYASVYGAMSHPFPVKYMTMQLDPQKIVSACESI